MVVLLEDCEDAFEEEDEEYGGDGGGLSPFRLFSFHLSYFPLTPPEEPSPLRGLKLSPCSLLFLSS